MKTLPLLLALLLFISIRMNAQVDQPKSDDLLSEISADDKASIALLPDRFLISQRIFWGERGLMRNFSRFELTPEKRQKELDIRRFMLVSHQVTGFATLAGMVAQGIVGAKLYKGENVRDLHTALAAGVNIGYFTTAGLSLFAPPKMLNERKGYSSIKLHKYLAIVHLSSMIATNILAGQLEGNPRLRPYHRAAAFTAFGSFATAMIVIKF
ncbi:MAG: hypothetical protein KKD74_10835 [Bacteroidetes bacterium]|nr:hypothetical protein [Bacteroidota bacterium]